MNDVTIITPTRDRPQQLQLVIDCINNQTVKPDKWVIVDDGPQPLSDQFLGKITVPLEYIWYEKICNKSVTQNSLRALQKVSTNKCIVIQDDDYYPRTYIQHMSQLLQGKQNALVGQLKWHIYRLSTGYYTIKDGVRKKPGCGTAFQWHAVGFIGEQIRRLIISAFTAVRGGWCPPDLLTQRIVDMKHFQQNIVDMKQHAAISLKDYGVGTPGVVSIHRSDAGLIRDSDDFSVFKSWLGSDWVKYQKYLGRLR